MCNNFHFDFQSVAELCKYHTGTFLPQLIYATFRLVFVEKGRLFVLFNPLVSYSWDNSLLLCLIASLKFSFKKVAIISCMFSTESICSCKVIRCVTNFASFVTFCKKSWNMTLPKRGRIGSVPFESSINTWFEYYFENVLLLLKSFIKTIDLMSKPVATWKLGIIFLQFGWRLEERFKGSHLYNTMLSEEQKPFDHLNRLIFNQIVDRFYTYLKISTKCRWSLSHL